MAPQNNLRRLFNLFKYKQTKNLSSSLVAEAVDILENNKRDPKLDENAEMLKTKVE